MPLKLDKIARATAIAEVGSESLRVLKFSHLRIKLARPANEMRRFKPVNMRGLEEMSGNRMATRGANVKLRRRVSKLKSSLSSAPKDGSAISVWQRAASTIISLIKTRWLKAKTGPSKPAEDPLIGSFRSTYQRGRLSERLRAMS